MAATIVVATIVSLYQFSVLEVPRPTGLNFSPIINGMVILVWSLFMLSRALHAPRIDRAKLIVALVGLIPVLLSGSKLVWACTAVGYPLVFVWWVLARGRWIVLAAVAVLSIPVAWLVSRMDFVQIRLARFASDFGAFLASGDTSGVTFGQRYSATVSGFLAFLDRPFLGYGLSRVDIAAARHRPPGFSDFSQLSHLHNDYIAHLVAFGLPGFLFIASVFAIFVVVAFRTGDPAMRPFAVATTVAFALYMVAEMVFIWTSLYGLIFFLLAVFFLARPNAGLAGRGEA
jgi:hypothetical protein